MADQNLMLGALGLCRKAGKLVMGFDAVAESVMKGKAVLVLTAQDLSPRTARKTREFCEGILHVQSMPLTQEQLCAVTHKPVGVYAVTDENLARLCEKHLSGLPHTEKEEKANGERFAD